MAGAGGKGTLWCPAGFGNSCAKTTGSHVALCECNSGTESGRELFRGLKDAESLLVCTRKKIFAWAVQVFVSDVISGGLLGHLGLLRLALGANR